ncbi:hypothetical protein D1007_32943 [Hordeum vulgare]|nr:hypothetical protein D1007_32943 [Hordeum vulgare]
MDSSCGGSSVGAKAGEELWKNSVIQAPTSVLQSMRERLFLLEIQEKKMKEDQEEEEKKERLLKDKKAKASAEEAARPTALAHGALEIDMSGESSSESKAREELGTITEVQANQIVERCEAQEEAVEVERAKPTARGTAARIAKMVAEGDAMIRKMTREERDRIIAKSMAEESARMSGEAANTKDQAGHDKEAGPAQCEEESFAAKFQSLWNRFYARCGVTFDQTTSIPAMCHTNPASDCSAEVMDTLQIMSVKVTSIEGSLHWPLEVFGIIAARDFLDRKRNLVIMGNFSANCILFFPCIYHSQLIVALRMQDCSLALTGPTRAIVVSYDPTYLEVFLKVKGTTESEDKDLSALVVVFRAGACPQSVYPSRLSMLEIKFDHIYHSVEATVFIRIIDGSWPDGFRGVFSAASGSDDNLQVKLLDFGDGGLPVDANGVITLSRPVVSVKLERNLKVSVMAFPINKGYAAETSEAVLKPHRAGF